MLAVLALVAVLALIAALALPALLDSDNQGQQPDPQPNNQQSGNPPANDGQDDQNAPPPAETTAAQPTPPQEPPPQETTRQTPPERTTEETQANDGLTEEAAVQTIQDHYAVAASDDYQNAWNFLSSRYQQELGSPEVWTSQFQTLESVEYTSGPTAQVNGNTATVTFSTRAVHTDRVDTPSFTATLVNENGEWKIDSLG